MLTALFIILIINTIIFIYKFICYISKNIISLFVIKELKKKEIVPKRKIYVVQNQFKSNNNLKKRKLSEISSLNICDQNILYPSFHSKEKEIYKNDNENKLKFRKLCSV